MENNLDKQVQYYLSGKAYKLLVESAKSINVKKSMFVDALIKRYAVELADDIKKKIGIYDDDNS